MARRPNILFIMADQMSALATGPYGNREVLTPNLDRLSRTGTVFERAYCNAPLCVPSRASMMTGLLGSDLPVNDNGEDLPTTAPTFAHHLRRGGYETVLSGKMHFVGPDQLHGFEQRLTTDIYPSDFLWTCGWPRLRALVAIAEHGEEALHKADAHRPLNATALQRSGPVAWSEQLSYDEEVQYRALEWLRHRSHRAVDRPWFLGVSFTHPHDPYLATRPYWDRYADVDITLPRDAPPGASPAHASDRWVNIHHGLVTVPAGTDDVYRSRRGYYASVTYIDDKVGELVEELSRLGLADDTIVIFTSDHGDQCGEHGMWFKRTLREWSARVPLLICGPDVAAGRRVDANVSLVDLFPTLMDIAGLELPAGYESYAPRPAGTSLAPWLARDAPAPWDRDVILEYNGDGTFAPIRALLSGRFKFVSTGGAPDQLFDLERDPDEWFNLAGEEACREVADRLRARILDGWDPEQMERRVLASQRRRVFLNEALHQGLYKPWDFETSFDASRAYTRPARGRQWASVVYERVLLDGRDHTELLERQEDLETGGHLPNES